MALVTEIDLAECVARCQRGDGDAFGLLYDRLAPDVARFLRGVSRRLRGARLDDAVQETFVRLLSRLPKLQQTAQLRAYTLGVARHVALDALRRAETRGRRELEVGARRLREAAEPADARLERAELAALGRELLDDLDPELRLVISLRHVSQLTMPELAIALGCSVPTARSRLRMAVRRLAAALRERGVDPGEVTA